MPAYQRPPQHLPQRARPPRRRRPGRRRRARLRQPGHRGHPYAELRDEVALAAGMLRGLGVGPGDRVLVDMAMVPEVVLKAGADIDPDTLRAEIVAMVRDRIGPVAALRAVHVVPALPKTRSGKILRRVMRDIADGRDAAVPSIIDDAAVIDALRPLLRGAG